MNKRAKCMIKGFKYPAADTISGRSSTICRSMACTLTERVACSPEVEQSWAGFFKEKKCAYCGDAATHLDHLYPLIENRRPTGYGTEPANLVPCCGKCNQVKGNLGWEEFMRGDKCHHVVDPRFSSIEEAKRARINLIQKFQDKMPATKKEIDEAVIKKWNEILCKFDRALCDANAELLKLKKELR